MINTTAIQEYATRLLALYQQENDDLTLYIDEQIDHITAIINREPPEDLSRIIARRAVANYLLHNPNYLQSIGVTNDNIRRLTEGEVTIEYGSNPRFLQLHEMTNYGNDEILRYRVLTW